MIYRKKYFDDDNVTAYIKVKKGKIIDVTGKNAISHNITNISDDECEMAFSNFINIPRTNDLVLNGDFFIECIYWQTNWDSWKQYMWVW